MTFGLIYSNIILSLAVNESPLGTPVVKTSLFIIISLSDS